MSTWRQSYPGVAAGEDFITQHPLVFLTYSAALIVVFLMVIIPLYYAIKPSETTSRFQGNLLYTGPGGSLDSVLGSCRSDRAQCGTAEPFADASSARMAAIRSQFANDAGRQRHMTERSRFLGERAPNPVFALDESDSDAMQAEINAITGDDNEAAVTVGMHQGDTNQSSSFAARRGNAEDALGAIAQGYA